MAGPGLVGVGRARQAEDVKPAPKKLKSVPAPLSDADSDFGMDDEDVKPAKPSKKRKTKTGSEAPDIKPATKRRRSADAGADDLSPLPRLQPRRSAPTRHKSSPKEEQQDAIPESLPEDSFEFLAVKRADRMRSASRAASTERRPQLGRTAKAEAGQAADGGRLSSASDLEPLEELEKLAAEAAGASSDSSEGFVLVGEKRPGEKDLSRDQLLERDREKLYKLGYSTGRKRARKSEPRTDPMTSNLAVLLGYRDARGRPGLDHSSDSEQLSSQVIINGVAVKRSLVSTGQLSNAVPDASPDDDDKTESESEAADSLGAGRSSANGVKAEGGGVVAGPSRLPSSGTVAGPKLRAGKMPVWNTWLARNKEIAKKSTEADHDANAIAHEQGMRPDFFIPRASRLSAPEPYVLDSLRNVKVPFAINRFLREYQRKGVQFFYDRYKGLKVTGKTMRGGVLGDDMGLGKTVQVIAFLSAIMSKSGTRDDLSRERNRKDRVRARQADDQATAATLLGPTCLIVCPTSLLENWRRELVTWGYFSFDIYEGRKHADLLRKYEQGFLDIVLTSHATLRSAHEQLSSVHFSVVIVDEAHTLKNKESGLTAAAKQLNADCRFALTGTLVQNRYGEMWSVLDFIAPRIFGKKGDWEALITKPLENGNKFDATVEELATGRELAVKLKEDVMPLFFLRRTKAEVATELPEKNDQVVFCPMTPVQEVCYERISLCKPMQEYLKKDDNCCGKTDQEGNILPRRLCCFKPNADDEYNKIVLKFISILKKLSSHLALLYPQASDTPAQNIASKDLLEVMFPDPELGAADDKATGAIAAQDFDPYFRSLDAYQAGRDVNLSGKWIVLKTLLASWYAENMAAGVGAENKVLVFSSSVRLLNLLEEFADTEGWRYTTLTGSIAGKDRMAVVDEFQSKPECFLFFISTLAGGVGLNLTAANRVVIFDPSWNPANDLQAMDRAFRMGQKRDVDVYRLIAKGTLEENIYERQLRKESAMRIAYDASDEVPTWTGTEKHPGKDTDLYGVKNMFTYHREGTTLFRMARSMNEKAMAAGSPPVIPGKTTLKIHTSYGDEGAWATEETEEGGQAILDKKLDEQLFRDFLGLDPVHSAAAAMDELAKNNPGLVTRKHLRTQRRVAKSVVGVPGPDPSSTQFARNPANYSVDEQPRAPATLASKGKAALVSDDED